MSARWIVAAFAGVATSALAMRKPVSAFMTDTRSGMQQREGQLRAQLARDTHLSLVGEVADTRAIQGP